MVIKKGNEEVITIFPDRPIEKKGQDKFSHNVYVQTLVKIIRSLLKDKSSINIGLFGKWGVGKTSIINLLVNSVREDSQLKNSVKVLTYNVWKHSKDCLRRQFLIFLDRELDTRTGIKDQLDQTSQESVAKFRFDWKMLGTFVIFSILIFGVITVVQQQLDIFLKFILSVLAGALILIFTETRKLLVRQQIISKTFHKIDQADQFEEKFKEIVSKAKGKWRKIIIIFDDLDRCPENMITETLGMIKTFLEEEDCIYIIPCNEEGIKGHLKRVMGYEKHEEEEFIKKFFQISLKIPPFLDEDIFSFVHELSEKAGFPKEVESVMISAFWETPRHIKQFLNNLTGLRALVVEKERVIDGKPGPIRAGVISGNLAFLAKIEATREKWPDVFQMIAANPAYLSEMENYASRNGDNADLAKTFNESPGLRNFLLSTTDIKTEELTPFLKLSQPTYLSNLSDSGAFELQAITGDVDYVKERLLDKRKGEDYLRALVKISKEKWKTGYSGPAFNALRMLVISYPEKRGDVPEELMEEAIEILDKPEISSKLVNMPMSNLFQIFVDSKKSPRCENMISNLIEQIGEV